MQSRLLLVLVCASCGFSGSTGDGTSDSEDGPPETIVDTNFEAGTLLSTDLAAPGVLEPAAYAVGGLRVRSYQDFNREGRPRFMIETESWDQLETRLAAFYRGTAYYRLPDVPMVDRDNAAPNLGIRQDDYVLVFDGEVKLAPGVHDVTIDPDDALRLEIGGPDAPVYSVFCDIDQDAVATQFTVPDGADWLPIRIALEDNTGASHASLRIDGALLAPDRLRAHVNGHRGVHVRARSANFTTRGEAVVPGLDDNFGGGAPANFPETGSDHWAMRYVGQIFIDVAGAYEFRAGVQDVAHDNARVRIDGDLVARTWFGESDPPAPIDLSAGWHDLLVDFLDETGDAALRVGMRRAGDVDFVAISPENLRPVAAVGLETLTYNGSFSATLMVGNAVTAVLQPMTPPDAIVEWQDVGVKIEPAPTTGVTVTATDCTTHAFALRNQVAQFFDNGESCRDQRPVPVALEIATSLDTYRVFEVGLVTSYHGGPVRPPYADQAVFESRELDTTGTSGLVSLEITGDPRDGRLRGFVRSGTNLEAAPWVEVGADGMVPAGTPFGDRSQYRIVMETGGWSRLTVDSVKLTYAKP